MRILFDQGTPVHIRDSLPGHDVRTAREQGSSTLSNGDHLRAAEDAGFQIVLTTDTHLPQQQEIKHRKLAVLILSRNHWPLIERRLTQIAAAVVSARAGTYSVIDIPDQ